MLSSILYMIRNILILLYFTQVVLWAQTQDGSLFATPASHKKNFFRISEWSEPKKASVMSAILPAAGQVYNKKYWKVPIIYGLGGLLVYNIGYQHQQYQYYKTELLRVLNGGSYTNNYSPQQLTLLKNDSKKWRDLSIAGLVVLYILNIIDAHVDAHFKTFDISDNLSIHISTQRVIPITTSNNGQLLISSQLNICLIF